MTASKTSNSANSKRANLNSANSSSAHPSSANLSSTGLSSGSWKESAEGSDAERSHQPADTPAVLDGQKTAPLGGQKRSVQPPSHAAHFAALLEAVAERRDKKAYIELFDYYGPRIKAYVLRLGTESMQAEELTQEVMITLWRKAHLFDRTKSSVATWLYRIARNRRIDLLRRRKSADLDREDPALHPEPFPDLGEEYDAMLREKRVRAALDGLPIAQRELIQLAFFKGLSHSEIADQTGLPLGTVKSRIRLAFTRLRRTFEADDAVDIDL